MKKAGRARFFAGFAGNRQKKTAPGGAVPKWSLQEKNQNAKWLASSAISGLAPALSVTISDWVSGNSLAK